jgi:hypothetical protein
MAGKYGHRADGQVKQHEKSDNSKMKYSTLSKTGVTARKDREGGRIRNQKTGKDGWMYKMGMGWAECDGHEALRAHSG